MAFGYIDKDKLIVYTPRSDLGYGKGRRGNWWALRAFSALCDQHVSLQYPMEFWQFPKDFLEPVKRIIAERNRDFELLDKKSCQKLAKEFVSL